MQGRRVDPSVYAQQAKSGHQGMQDPTRSSIPQDPNWAFAGQGKSPKRKGNLAKWIKIAKILLLIAAGYFIYLNIQPYIAIVELMLASATENGIWVFINRLWLIGPLLRWIADIQTSLLAIVLWMVIQFFELLPSLLERNRQSIQLLITGLERVSKMTPTDADDKLVARLKEKYNTFPHRLINRARWVSILVYICDFFLCIWKFPPIHGGADALGLFIMAPRVEDIDMQNALTCVATLFAVEIIYHGYNWLTNMMETFTIKESKSV